MEEVMKRMICLLVLFSLFVCYSLEAQEESTINKLLNINEKMKAGVVKATNDPKGMIKKGISGINDATEWTMDKLAGTSYSLKMFRKFEDAKVRYVEIELVNREILRDIVSFSDAMENIPSAKEFFKETFSRFIHPKYISIYRLVPHGFEQGFTFRWEGKTFYNGNYNGSSRINRNLAKRLKIRVPLDREELYPEDFYYKHY